MHFVQPIAVRPTSNCGLSLISCFALIGMLLPVSGSGSDSLFVARVAGDTEPSPAVNEFGIPNPLVIMNYESINNVSEKRFALACQRRFGEVERASGDDIQFDRLQQTTEITALEMLYPRARFTVCKTRKGVIEYVWGMDEKQWFLWDRNRFDATIAYVESLSEASRAELRTVVDQARDERQKRARKIGEENNKKAEERRLGRFRANLKPGSLIRVNDQSGRVLRVDLEKNRVYFEIFNLVDPPSNKRTLQSSAPTNMVFPYSYQY